MSCLFLRGSLYLKKAPRECPPNVSNCPPKGGNYRKLGNSSTCQINVLSEVFGSENEFHKVNPENRVTINQVTLDLQIEDVSNANLLLAFESLKTEILHDTITQRLQVCGTNENFILSYNPLPDTLTLIGLDSFGDFVKIYVEGVDYTREGSLVVIDGIDPDIKTIEASYEFRNSLIDSFSVDKIRPIYYELFFIGENINTGERVEVRFYRTIFSLVEMFDLIAKSEFTSLPLKGIVEKSNHGYFKYTTLRGNNESSSVIY